MTSNRIECDVAHLCPRSEADWFRSNDMDQYVSQRNRVGTIAIDDPANSLLLRADLHCSFDKLQFIFVPKASGVLVTHILNENIELCSLYHNATLHQAGVGPQFLFARFAWAIFPVLKGFIQKGQRRLLKLATEQEERWVDADECEELGNTTFGRSKVAGKSKSASPTKRSRHDADVEDIDELKEDAAGPSKQMKIHDSRSDDSLSSTASQADDLTTLVQQRLEFERARSDPKGTWLTELNWYKGILDNGGGLDASELPRYLNVTGRELVPGETF